MWLQQLPNGTSLHDVIFWIDGIGLPERLSGTAPTLTNVTFGSTGNKAGAVDINFVKDSSIYNTNLGNSAIGVGDVTATCWVKLTGIEGSAPRLIYNGKFDLRTGASKVHFSSDGVIFTDLTSALTNDVYTFVTVTRTSAGVANVYLDAVLNGDADQPSGTPVAGSTATTIGSISSAIRTLNGAMANIIVFKKILTVEQMGQMYNKHKKA